MDHSDGRQVRMQFSCALLPSSWLLRVDPEIKLMLIQKCPEHIFIMVGSGSRVSVVSFRYAKLEPILSPTWTTSLAWRCPRLALLI